MKTTLAIGTRQEEITLPDTSPITILKPNAVKVETTGVPEVIRAFEEPIGSPHLSEIVKPHDKVCIITSDITRPMPTYKVMPVLLDILYSSGIDKEDICLVFGLGNHRLQTEEEKKKLAGERAYNEIKCIDSKECEFVHLGYTKYGTPVDIARPVIDADIRICLGNIEYHYFAGYSGGAKAVMPGVSTKEAIQNNHKNMIKEEACCGRLAGNPVREDIEEAASMVGVDYILNVVLDEKKEIIHAVSGDVTLAHREGCSFLDSLFMTPFEERADIVIVSQGGAPKDLNLYQTQKALDNAKHAIKKGGTIVLAGSCKEGLGDQTFTEWITEAKKPHDLIDRIKKEFKLGGHKAAAIAMVLENAEIYLVSDMDHALVESIFMKPFDDIQTAVDAALEKQGEGCSIIVMPYGGSTLPKSVNN